MTLQEELQVEAQDLPLSWAAQVTAAARHLDQFVGASEERFLTFGGRLQECLDRAQHVAEGATRAVKSVGGEELEQIVENFREQAEALGRHTEVADAQLEDLAARLNHTVGDLATISGSHKRFAATVRSLRTLGVASLIESARLGESGVGFALLAADVQKFGEEIAQRFDQVLDRSRQLERNLGGSENAVTEARFGQRDGLHTALQELQGGLERLLAVNQQGAASGRDLESRSHGLGTAISSILGSLQFQDITRQRLEHVRDSLMRLTGEPVSAEGDTAEATIEAAALWGAVCRLQREQLSAAETDFAEAMGDILTEHEVVTAAARTVSQTARGLSGDSGIGAAGELEELQSALRGILDVIGEAVRRNKEIGEVLSAAAHTAAEMTQFVDGIDLVGSDLELIAINAIIKSSQVGEGGRPLAVIAQEIQRQSVEARRITGRVADKLREIGADSVELENLAVGFSEGNQLETSEVVQRLEHALNGLAAARREFEVALQRLGEESGALDRLLTDADQAGEFRDEVSQVVGRVQDMLEVVEQDAAERAAGLDSDRHAALLADMEAEYTMRSQREVHYETLNREDGAGVGSPDGDGMLGDNVELF